MLKLEVCLTAFWMVALRLFKGLPVFSGPPKKTDPCGFWFLCRSNVPFRAGCHQCLREGGSMDAGPDLAGADGAARRGPTSA